MSTHTVFSTTCAEFFDWQALGLAFSHRRVGQPGPLTRLLACDDEQRAERSASLGVRVHRHPNYGQPEHNRVQDSYAPYNKPGGVLHWLTHAHERIAEHFVLVVESDMLLRQPIDCAALGVRPGVGASGVYDYLHGVRNGMARAFIKHVAAVQPVGGWYCLHRDDLARLAPLWLELTKQVRKNPQRYWHMPTDPTSVAEDLATGDTYATRGKPPFIADLYGYAFAAAEAGVTHVEHPGLMAYAGAPPDPTLLGGPSLLHYGLFCSISAPPAAAAAAALGGGGGGGSAGGGVDGGGGGWRPYAFNKLSYSHSHAGGFDPHACHHWLPTPPAPRVLAAALGRAELGPALLCAEVAPAVNEALCEYRMTGRAGCPPDELEGGCPVPRLAEVVAAQLESDAIGTPRRCADLDDRCAEWAAMAQCDENAEFMLPTCALSCGAPQCQVAAAAAAAGGGGGAGGGAGGGGEPGGGEAAVDAAEAVEARIAAELAGQQRRWMAEAAARLEAELGDAAVVSVAGAAPPSPPPTPPPTARGMPGGGGGGAGGGGGLGGEDDSEEAEEERARAEAEAEFGGARGSRRMRGLLERRARGGAGPLAELEIARGEEQQFLEGAEEEAPATGAAVTAGALKAGGADAAGAGGDGGANAGGGAGGATAKPSAAAARAILAQQQRQALIQRAAKAKAAAQEKEMRAARLHDVPVAPPPPPPPSPPPPSPPPPQQQGEASVAGVTVADDALPSGEAEHEPWDALDALFAAAALLVACVALAAGRAVAQRLCWRKRRRVAID